MGKWLNEIVYIFLKKGKKIEELYIKKEWEKESEGRNEIT